MSIQRLDIILIHSHTEQVERLFLACFMLIIHRALKILYALIEMLKHENDFERHKQHHNRSFIWLRNRSS